MSGRIPVKFPTRLAAAKRLAQVLGYKISDGRVYDSYEAFADAINLPHDGTIPLALRVAIEDYTMPPLAEERGTEDDYGHSRR